MTDRFCRAFVLLAGLVAIPLTVPLAAAEEAVVSAPSFAREILPILTDQCLACHGVDEAARQADLRLDVRQAAVDSGAIVPGDAAASELVRRIHSDDEGELMPPPESHKTLTAKQRQLLAAWIDAGAPYEGHWAFEPIEQQAVPSSGGEWARNPIDAFIARGHEQAGLTANEPEESRRLLRRVCLDLTGLPPTAEQIEAAANDDRPDAYERFVDRLLDSTGWGEHRGRYWLDYARYADTHGIHFDNFREMYSYRDWVIEAFNRNQPFDKFTIEQLAGDLLENPTLEQKIATGFQRCNITTNEGGIIDEEYAVLYARDRVETTGAVWLGLTVGCAVCHDHKYDPISQREFYELAAFFNNTAQPVRDGNIHDTPPVLRLAPPGRQKDLERLQAEDRRLTEQLATITKTATENFDQLLTAADQKPATQPPAPPSDGRQIAVVALPDGDSLPVAIESTSVFTANIAASQTEKYAARVQAAENGIVGSQAITLKKGSGLELPIDAGVQADRPFHVSLWIKPAKKRQDGPVVSQMNVSREFRGWDVWMQTGRIGMHLIDRWDSSAIKVVTKEELPTDRYSHVLISYDGSGKAAGLTIYRDGSQVPTDVEKDTLSGPIDTDVPLMIGGRSGSEGSVSASLQDIRLMTGTLHADWRSLLIDRLKRQHMLQLAQRQKLPNERRGELIELLLNEQREDYRLLRARSQSVKAEVDGLIAAGTVAHVMQEKADPPMAYVLHRGEYDQRRDEVRPNTLDVLPPMPEPQGQYPNRLTLARWLTSPDHPLTARVTVNRCWQEIFGRGLVTTAGDFGTTGSYPSHPELLDYLAGEFIAHGWDLKWLYRQMVTSATYRQAANRSADDPDPENIYLARGPRYRMDAEMVRDLALATSGLLSGRIGGESVRPYQPPGVWEAVAMPGSNTRNYEQDHGERLYRRGMYTFWKRAAPPAALEVLNAPNRETSCVARERTNTPLQALLVLNDVQYIEASRRLAELAILETDADDSTAVANFLAMRLLSRPLTDDELAVTSALLADAREFYNSHVDEARSLVATGEATLLAEHDPSCLAAVTLLANQLMNLDETLCK